MDASDEEIQVLNGLGTTYREERKDYERVKAHYNQALDLSRKNANRLEEAKAHDNLGVTAHYQKNYDEAIEHYQQALKTRRAIGDRVGEGISLGNLARLTRDAGDYAQAIHYLSEASTIHKTVGNRREEANVLNDLGIIHLFVGKFAAAETDFRRGLRINEEIGDEIGQAYIMLNLALVYREQGTLDLAERLLLDGSKMIQEKDEYAFSYFLSHLGIIKLRLGEFDQAIEKATLAAAIRLKSNEEKLTTADLATLAAAHLEKGQTELAVKYAQEAVAILDQCGDMDTEFPHYDYFVCYQTLSAVEQTDDAYAALQSAYKLVIDIAAKITDPAMRKSFLEQTPVNREIIQTVENIAHV